jgi:hypothetical protein
LFTEREADVLPYPPYSSDLVQPDFWPSLRMKYPLQWAPVSIKKCNGNSSLLHGKYTTKEEFVKYFQS